jgi:hypothetical protein
LSRRKGKKLSYQEKVLHEEGRFSEQRFSPVEQRFQAMIVDSLVGFDQGLCRCQVRPRANVAALGIPYPAAVGPPNLQLCLTRGADLTRIE